VDEAGIGAFAQTDLGASTADAAPRSASAAGPITRIGRFTVLRPLGQGGMGAVYTAYDESLDRRVAVKLLLRPRDANARVRMLREAQALAKVSHPNVVAVFEVGEHDAQPYIAMEFVRGENLADWHLRRRPWQEVIRIYVLAGRGLAAAHAAGLVHRDFKPHNVMIDDDATGGSRRVRVLDFGLAGRSPAGDELVAEPPIVDATALDTPLTHAGAVMGTPAYMAPEQIAGRPATAYSDQFSFCVSLWEALYGERPFAGATPLEVFARVSGGERALPSAPRDTPSWVLPVLERGLDGEPSRRWPDMPTLLAALERGLGRARRRWWGVGIAGAIVLSSASVWALAGSASICDRFVGELETDWNPGRRDRLHADLAAVDAEFAVSSAGLVVEGLDGYAQSWMVARHGACTASVERHEHTEALMLAQLRCLDVRKAAFVALIDGLAAPTVDRLAHATAAVSGLPRIAACSDPQYVLAEVPPPDDPELARAVEELDADITRAAALAELGDFVAAHALAQTCLARAQQLGYAPAEIRAGNELAWILVSQAEYPEARRIIEAAYLRVGRAAVEDDAASHQVLARVLWYQGEYSHALREARKALVMSTDAFGPEHVGLAESHELIGLVLNDLGDAQGSLAEHRAALELRERILGPDHPEVGTSLANLGIRLEERGEYAEALTDQRRALAIFERAFGPQHPSVAVALTNIASVLLNTGELDASMTETKRALAIRLAAFGPDHPLVAASHNEIGMVLRAQGDYAGALNESRKALEILQHKLGPEHPGLATGITNVGSNMLATGEGEGALREFRRALELLVRTLGSEHVQVGEAHLELGFALGSLDRQVEALAPIREGLAILEKSLPADHLDLARAHHNLGSVLSRLGHHDEGLAELRLALEIREGKLGPDHTRVAETRRALATALGDNGEYAESLSELRVVMALQLRELGPEHPSIASTHDEIGSLLMILGDHPGALAERRRALEIREHAFSPGHPLLARSHRTVGSSLRRSGELTASRAELELALGYWDEAPLSSPAEQGRTLSQLAATAVLAGERRQLGAAQERLQRVAAANPEVPELAVMVELVDALGAPRMSGRARARMTQLRDELASAREFGLVDIADHWLEPPRDTDR
jgi:eukaryotic-like serine/threonine-protein kinase